MLVLEDDLGHEQEHNFIRGREKSDRGGKWGWRGGGIVGEGEGSGGKGGGEWGMGTPLSTPSVNDARCINQLETANKQRI